VGDRADAEPARSILRLTTTNDSTPRALVHIFADGQMLDRAMRNLLEQAIDSDDGDLAAKMIRDALGIESDEITNHSFPKHWPENREQRARVIGDWLKDEARFLVYE
jgi:hypothetical protein